MGMHAFRRLREQEAAAAAAASIAEVATQQRTGAPDAPDFSEQQPAKRRGRKPKSEASTTAPEN